MSIQIRLLDFTTNALDLLIFTKGQRLSAKPMSYGEVARLPEEEKLKILDYMLGTNPGSWEFTNYTFYIYELPHSFPPDQDHSGQ